MDLDQRKTESFRKRVLSAPKPLPEMATQESYSTKLEKKKPRPVWRREWHLADIHRLIAIGSLHLLCLFAPFYVTPGAFWVFACLSIITGMFGITLSYHRNLTHGSFTLPKWLEYTFAYCGVLAFQGSPIGWVSVHRLHHQHVDSDRDPHSPNEGFWFCHILWAFDRAYLREKRGKHNNVSDLGRQPFYQFIQKTYPFHPLALAPLLYAVGGFPWLVWGMGVRVVVTLHATWLVNSACHAWGNQPWNTNDLSRNNWLVGILAFGEGWHNNHHSFEYSARHGLEWWQIDMTWGVIRFLEAVGLATNVKLPREEHKKRLAFPSSSTDDALLTKNQ